VYSICSYAELGEKAQGRDLKWCLGNKEKKTVQEQQLGQVLHHFPLPNSAFLTGRKEKIRKKKKIGGESDEKKRAKTVCTTCYRVAAFSVRSW